MRIGVPREIKVHEYRVGLVPAGVRELTGAGHEVLIETASGSMTSSFAPRAPRLRRRPLRCSSEPIWSSR